uniref:Ionotropic receptor 22 n=1 Tax=Locusta migratoria TaxID=7004 RepID=A0A0K2D699_LOCMI|nr:ionotropic receptor 22 [Locusta migratoria]
MDEGHQADCVFLDFKKAFDTVPHCRLLTKIRAYGIGSQLCDWLEDVLSNRTQPAFMFREPSLAAVGNVYTRPFSRGVWLSYSLAAMLLALLVVGSQRLLASARGLLDDMTDPAVAPPWADVPLVGFSIICEEGASLVWGYELLSAFSAVHSFFNKHTVYYNPLSIFVFEIFDFEIRESFSGHPVFSTRELDQFLYQRTSKTLQEINNFFSSMILSVHSRRSPIEFPEHFRDNRALVEPTSNEPSCSPLNCFYISSKRDRKYHKNNWMYFKVRVNPYCEGYRDTFNINARPTPWRWSGIRPPPQNVSSRILLMFLLVLAVFHVTAYSACIVSLLQLPSGSINDLHSLFGSKLRVVMQNLPYNFNYGNTHLVTPLCLAVKETKDPLTRSFYQERVYPQPYGKVFKPLEDCVALMRGGRFACHADEAAYKVIGDTFLEAEKCSLKSVPMFPLRAIILGVRKHSQYKETLSVIQAWLRETGLLKREWTRWVAQKPRCLNRDSGYAEVGLTEVSPALLMLCYGVAGSLVALLLELLLHRAIAARPGRHQRQPKTPARGNALVNRAFLR